MKLTGRKLRSGVLAVALFATSVVMAQSKSTTKAALEPKLGIKAGANFSNFFIDEVDDANMKVGFHGGVYAQLPISALFSIQPELLYSSKGSKITYNNFIMGNGEYRFNLNYIEMPVLAVVHLGPSINLHAGPYIAYLAGVNVTNLDENNNSVDQITSLDADDYNRFDYGLSGGVGFTVDALNFGARYSYGFSAIGENSDNVSLANYVFRDTKNSNFQLYLGFSF
ncbi:MAG TPA: porin family protein [Phnomibacter sp.]|nr:porin family protein [Phnomibacter sp.]